VLELLDPHPGEAALDVTAGTGGHALALAARLGPQGLLVGMDRDLQALQVAKTRLAEAAACRFRLFQWRFSEAAQVAREAGVERFDVVLADLGVGAHQLDDPARGFGFQSECRLDMRFDTSQEPTAWDIVNKMPERELADVFYRLGGERYSRPIAAAICEARRRAPIESPAELAALVTRVYARRSRGRTWRIHPATRVAMAIRIAVNDELGELDRLLEALPSLLANGGRAAVLTYHSLEARRVKQAWRSQQRDGVLELLTDRPIRPSAEEVRENPRVRSAQLRAARRL
jgi:16S rRNA (cytosine1402-N4)-methyltransferase